jgi:hypothetical protein
MTVHPYRRIRIDADPRVVLGHVMELLGFKRAARDPGKSTLAWTGVLGGLGVMLACFWFFRRDTGAILVGSLAGLAVSIVSVIFVYRARGWWFKGHGFRLGVDWEESDGVARLAVVTGRGRVAEHELPGLPDANGEVAEPPPRPALYPAVVEPLAAAAGAVVGRDLLSVLPEGRAAVLRGLVLLGTVLGLLETREFGNFRKGRQLGQLETLLGLGGVTLQAIGAISGHWAAALFLGAALIAAPIAIRLARGGAIWCDAGEVRLELTDRVADGVYTLRIKSSDEDEEAELNVDAVLSGGLSVRHPEALERFAGDLFDRIGRSGAD